ncbi:hypothetical protein [Pseudoalteromonas ruthenica]|uniref:hypothetical protein n=1 Tax=Pseudoalteromonas ruthenica TaxID=151081 RepID=UPI00211E1A47|nr:hypothetical protein [Pseudoalteromonas ruthenica]
MFWRSLLIGLTTVFAWLPASFLMIFALIGLFGGVANIFTMPIGFSLQWILCSLGGILGYVVLTSVSWGFKLKHKVRLLFLIFGFLSLIFTHSSVIDLDGDLFKLGDGWVELYMLLCPAIFLAVHIVLHLFWMSQDNLASA